MSHQPNLKREARYGLPTADQILYNRFHVIGYSYYFRQAKWALEIVSPEVAEVQRKDHFRPDYRIPEKFRADLDVYENSGYDRGHLVSSANQKENDLQNSETFLLSNMAPQKPKFNREIWKELEVAVRTLDSHKKVFETYVITGPIFYFDQEVIMMGDENENIDVSLPIPHAFFKSVLTESNTGRISMWSFIIPNEPTFDRLEDFLVPTTKVEKISGLLLWETLVGTKMVNKKNRLRKMWKY